MKSINVKNYKEGLRDGVPIALGYLAVAFTLGIAARNFGIHAFPATIMSLTNVQIRFAAYDLLYRTLSGKNSLLFTFSLFRQKIRRHAITHRRTFGYFFFCNCSEPSKIS